MASSRAKINKYLTVEKNKITTKIPARIFLDLSEYKDVDDEYGESIGIEDIESVYKIPGFFKLEFPEEEDSIDFFFPYSIYLNKTENTEVTSKSIEINFQADEMLFYSNFKDSKTDVRVLKSLFENGAKYLGNKPDKLITAIWQQMISEVNVPLQHLEIIVSQLYGTYDKTKKEVVPLRLTNEAYSKKHIMNIKQSAHNLNSALAFSYGYSKDALRTSVSKKKKRKNSFFEDIMSGDYDALVERSKDNKEKEKL